LAGKLSIIEAREKARQALQCGKNNFARRKDAPISSSAFSTPKSEVVEQSSKSKKSDWYLRPGKLVGKILDVQQKGGKARVAFLVVMGVGDGHGTLGLGKATSTNLYDAARLAKKKAKMNAVYVPLREDRTLPKDTAGSFNNVHVKLHAADAGTGIIADAAMSKFLRAAGVQDAVVQATNEQRASSLMAAFAALKREAKHQQK